MLPEVMKNIFIGTKIMLFVLKLSLFRIFKLYTRITWGWLDAENLLDERTRMSSKCWLTPWIGKLSTAGDEWVMESNDMLPCKMAAFAFCLVVLWLKPRSATARLYLQRECFRRLPRAMRNETKIVQLLAILSYGSFL